MSRIHGIPGGYRYGICEYTVKKMYLFHQINVDGLKTSEWQSYQGTRRLGYTYIHGGIQ
jgi:hypothetical protein